MSCRGIEAINSHNITHSSRIQSEMHTKVMLVGSARLFAVTCDNISSLSVNHIILTSK